MSEKEKLTSLEGAAGLSYLTQNNASFFKNRDFIGAVLKNGEGEEKEVRHERVWLHRSFPFDMPDEFISVQNKDSEEIGLIRALSDFDSETVALLKGELDRKYHTPKIQKILQLKETRGFSFWKVITDSGELSFTLQDTYRSITRVSEDRAFIFDICGNRFEIQSISALDKNSYRKIELYL